MGRLLEKRTNAPSSGCRRSCPTSAADCVISRTATDHCILTMAPRRLTPWRSAASGAHDLSNQFGRLAPLVCCSGMLPSPVPPRREPFELHLGAILRLRPPIEDGCRERFTGRKHNVLLIKLERAVGTYADVTAEATLPCPFDPDSCDVDDWVGSLDTAVPMNTTSARAKRSSGCSMTTHWA